MDQPDMPIELKTGITGAAATIQQPAKGRETNHIFEASIVVYMRPNNVSATEKGSNPQQALKGALDAVGHQIRDQRKKLRDERRSSDNEF